MDPTPAINASSVAALTDALTTLSGIITEALGKFPAPEPAAKLEANTATVEDTLDPSNMDGEAPNEDDDNDPGQDEGQGHDDAHDDDKSDAEQEYADLVAKMEEANKKIEALTAANRVLAEENARYSAVQTKQIAEQRDAVLLAAIKDGRIDPSHRAGYEAWAAVDPEQCAAHIANLTPTNPTVELGYAADDLGTDTHDAQSPDHLLAGTPWGNSEQ